ncbi:MAG: transporter substrate-binding domain-containing protein [Thermodesulfobacteriota bacterium]
MSPLAAEKKVIIGLGMYNPPYIIQETLAGIEPDVLRESFKVRGYHVEFTVHQFPRLFKELESGTVDGVFDVREGVEGFKSDVVVSYQNYAISLSENRLAIKSIKDLEDKSVVSFYKSSQLLGEEYEKMAKQNKNYEEVMAQNLQVKMLFRKRVEVVIMDKNIFSYYRQKEMEKESTEDMHGSELSVFNQQVDFHALFPPKEYGYIFNSEEVRDDFNEGLRAIKQNGTYSKINQKYYCLGKLSDTANCQ